MVSKICYIYQQTVDFQIARGDDMNAYKLPLDPMNRSLGHLLFGSILRREKATRICFVDTKTGRAMLYHDVEEDTARAARLFIWMHAQPGDTISIMLEHGIHFFTPWLGALRMGAVINPINYYYFFGSPHKIINILEKTHARILVLEEKWAWNFKERRQTLLLDVIRDAFPRLLILIATPFDKTTSLPLGCTAPLTHGWNELIRVSSGMERRFDDFIHRPPESPCELVSLDGNIVETFTHGELVSQTERYARANKISEEDRACVTENLLLPETQIRTFFPLIYKGGATILVPLDLPHAMGKFLPHLTKWHVSHLYATSIMLNRMLSSPILHSGSKSIRLINADHIMITDELHEQFEKKTGIEIRLSHTFCTKKCKK